MKKQQPNVIVFVQHTYVVPYTVHVFVIMNKIVFFPFQLSAQARALL